MTEPTRLYPVWLSRLVFPFRYGKLASGLLIFAVMWVLLIGWSASGELGFYAELFFAATCAYIVPIYSRIADRFVATFDAIKGTLIASPEECARWRLALTHHSLAWILTTIILALGMGVANIVISHPSGCSGLVEELLSGTAKYKTYMFTLLVWVTMTTAISALLANAQLFGHLGRRMRIDLLHSPALLLMSRVAIMSTLSVIGAQTLFVFLLLDAKVRWTDFLPGFAATMLPVLALFLLPVWPLHRRLKAAKRAELANINRQLDHLRPQAATAIDHPASLDQVNRLLLYRREIQQVSEWPFDVPALTQLGLYLIIPPLTWVASALIEKLVDRLV